jgi:hypothetical protein
MRLKTCLRAGCQWINMFIHKILRLPGMTWKEIHTYKKILLSLNTLSINDKLEIFEYGSGMSTVYFAKFLRKRNIKFCIHSVDNAAEWHEKIKKEITRNDLDAWVTLHLSAFPPFWEKAGWDWAVEQYPGAFAPCDVEEIQYVEMPLTLGRKFDLISVDGRFRCYCLKIAPTCLKKNGVVFLHDAHNKKYHRSLSFFRYSELYASGKFMPCDNGNWKYWVGSMDNPTLSNLINFCNKNSRVNQ